MLFLLSPAKSLDFEGPIKLKTTSSPDFLRQAQELTQVAAKLSALQLQHLMDISPALAELNRSRFNEWQTEHEIGDRVRQAVFAFDGDVYNGLDVQSLGKVDINYLQKHLRILSGLYGLLRPLDTIRPYRLEMGSQLKTAKANNLYGYWGDSLSVAVNQALSELKTKYLVNLASEEYFKVIKVSMLDAKVITPVFEDFSNGRFKIVSFFAKKARGAMVRYCAINRIKQVSALKQFDLEGYRYCNEASSENRWIFRRHL